MGLIDRLKKRFAAESAETVGIRGAGASDQATFGEAIDLDDLIFAVKREPVAHRVVFQVAHDIFDNWFEVAEVAEKPDPDFNRLVQKALDELNAKSVFTEMAAYERLAGWAVIVVGFADYGEDLAKPVERPTEIQELAAYMGDKQIQVNYYPNELSKNCSIIKQIRIEQGNTADYKVLAGFHYRSHHVGAVRKIFRAVRDDEICGVIVYTYPGMGVAGHRKVLPKMEVSELNQKLSNIMRVVVHPKYRTIGLGQKLVQETLDKCGTLYVETTAVMARYNPFFERAGMTKILEVTPPKQAITIREVLRNLGFNITLLSSEKYVLSQLKRLTNTELAMVRQAFIKNAHLRFMKEFFYHQPYGKRLLYIQTVETASLEKLSKLIHITALLLQTKIYLFWQHPNWERIDDFSLNY